MSRSRRHNPNNPNCSYYDGPDMVRSSSPDSDFCTCPPLEDQNGRSTDEGMPEAPRPGPDPCRDLEHVLDVNTMRHAMQLWNALGVQHVNGDALPQHMWDSALKYVEEQGADLELCSVEKRELHEKVQNERFVLMTLNQGLAPLMQSEPTGVLPAGREAMNVKPEPAAWTMEPATRKQLGYLQNCIGITKDRELATEILEAIHRGGLTKGEAGAYIGQIQGRKPKPKQVEPKHTLYLFTTKCGHRFIGAIEGSYACPVCGLHDGDHHLLTMDEVPVQLDDWNGGLIFQELAEAASKVETGGFST